MNTCRGSGVRCGGSKEDVELLNVRMSCDDKLVVAKGKAAVVDVVFVVDAEAVIEPTMSIGVEEPGVPVGRPGGLLGDNGGSGIGTGLSQCDCNVVSFVSLFCLSFFILSFILFFWSLYPQSLIQTIIMPPLFTALSYRLGDLWLS